MGSNHVPGNDLLARLAGVRRRIRWLLALEAVGRILLVSVLYAVVVAGADWWVHFPGYARLIFNATFVVLIGRYAWRRVYRPATVPIHLDQIALILPELPGELRDRLAASVAYLDHGGAGSSALWQTVIEQTSDSLGHARLARGIRPERARRWMTAGVLSVLGMAALATWQGPLVRVGLARLTTPLGDSAWPRRVEIVPLTGDAVVAVGESFEVAMRVARGESRLHRVYLNLHLPFGRIQREVLRRGADGVYRRTLDAIRADVQYSFACGDHDLSDSPFTIRAATRPEVVALNAEVSLPSYAGSIAPELQADTEEGFHAIRGGSLRLRATCHLPSAAQRSNASVKLELEDGRTVEMHHGEEAEWTATLLAEESTSFVIELRDGLGLTPRDRRSYRLFVRADQPPSARIIEPTGVLDITPRAELDLVVHAEDDVGLTGVLLAASVERVSAERQPSQWTADLLAEGVDLKTDAIAGATSIAEPAAVQPAGSTASPREVQRAYRWSLAELNVQPGDSVIYHVESRDAFVQDGSPRTVRTLPQRLIVLSPPDFAKRLRDELLTSQRSLRRLLADIVSIEGRTRALEEAQAISRATTRPLAAELRRARQSAALILDRLQLVIDRGYANRLGHDDAVQMTRRVHQEVSAISDEFLELAAVALEAIPDEPEASTATRLVVTALEMESRAITGIHAILDRLARWNDYEELVRRVRELQERQEALIRVVAEAARAAQDLRMDTLGGAGSGAEGNGANAPRVLDTAAQDQRQLSAEATRLLLSMKDFGREVEGVKPARVAALEAAADLGYRHNVVGRMEEAVAELSAGRAGLAGDAQAGAAAGLRAMVALLEDAPQRELSLLSKALADAADRLKKIILAQRDLIGRTESAQPEWARLVTRQSTLARTTSAFSAGIKVADSESETVREHTGKSSEEMLAAADGLSAGDGIRARTRQDAALELLETALRVLERRQSEADQAAAEKSLAALAERLIAIHREQGLIHTDTQWFASRSADAARLTRADVLRAGQLVLRQSTLKEQLEEAREKMAGSIVFNHVAARVAQDMSESAGLLDARAWDGALAVQERILGALRQLIGAIETLPRPDPSKQFADAAGAGQSAAQPTMERLIPPLAELKVLRSMQQALHEQTVRWASVKGESEADSQRRHEALRAVGTGQRELHELATQLIEQSASQGSAP